jgi:antitoxin CptB
MPMTEDHATRLRRLRLRSMRRGIKEMDLILTAFSAGLEGLTLDEVAVYDRLLAENDLDLLAWITGQMAPPALYAALVGRIAATKLA